MVDEKKLANFFSAMSDPTRLKIIRSISSRRLNVNDISRELGVSISAVSHQLRQLYNLGLVKYEKNGREKFYIVSDNHVIRIIKEGVDHIEKLPRP